MAEATKVKALAADFADIADFVTIYIREIHASDGWSFVGHRYPIKQPTTVQERVLAARFLLDDDALRPPGTFFIDKLDNQALKLYGALPERAYIALDGVIVFQGKLGPFGYHLSEVREWLENFRRKTS